MLCAATAHAQDKPVDPKVAAKEHYAKGTSFYDLGRYDEAVKEFEAALLSTPGVSLKTI